MINPNTAPSIKISLITFLVGGPLIYAPVLLAFGGNVHALDPITWMFSAAFWITALGNPMLWLTTWIPTASAAIVCSVALRRLARTPWYGRSPGWVVLAIGSVVSGFLSGLVYLFCSRLSVALGPVNHGQLTPPMEPYSLHADGVRFAMLGYGVPLVAVVGALLGGGLAWCSHSFDRSGNHAK
jgi:hypothetical protein